VPTFRVLSWRSIPTQVGVTADDGSTAKQPMARWFMQEISRITMREGLAATDDYLDEFAWSAPEARDGSPDAVMAGVMAEQAARFGRRSDGHPIEGVERYAGDGTEG
jgi:hypothetical protein